MSRLQSRYTLLEKMLSKILWQRMHKSLMNNTDDRKNYGRQHNNPSPSWYELKLFHKNFGDFWLPRDSALQLLKLSTYPMHGGWKYIKDTFTQYKSWQYVRNDLLTPVYGLGHLLLGIFKILKALGYLILTILNVINQNAFTLFRPRSSDPYEYEDIKKASILSDLKDDTKFSFTMCLSHLISGLLTMLKGLLQILAWPLSWIRIIPRGLLTTCQGFQNFIDNKGVKFLQKKMKKTQKVNSQQDLKGSQVMAEFHNLRKIAEWANGDKNDECNCAAMRPLPAEELDVNLTTHDLVNLFNAKMMKAHKRGQKIPASRFDKNIADTNIDLSKYSKIIEFDGPHKGLIEFGHPKKYGSVPEILRDFLPHMQPPSSKKTKRCAVYASG